MDKKTWLLTLVICCASGNQTLSWFREEAAARGLKFQHFHGGTGQYYLPESLGSGVALIDYDGDDDLDVYCLQGATLDPARKGWLPPAASPSNRLFRNMLREEKQLRFVDVTTAAGVAVPGYSLGAAVADYDADGDEDLLVTGVGRIALLQNKGNGTFRDVSLVAGINDSRISTSAAFLDYDHDNDLDLLVLSYVDFTVAGNKKCPDAKNRLDYCQPAQYHPLPAKLFRNEGGGKFSDQSQSSGIASAAGAGLGIALGDFNNDGWLDAYVANDGTPNHLWINQKNGRFLETALEAGAAYDDQGRALAGMGVSTGDFDNDGDEDLAVANLMGEGLSIYENDGNGEFRHASARRRITPPSLPFTGFGTGWADFDHDGRLDLFVANGSVRILDHLVKQPYPYGQRDQIFRNSGSAFEELRLPELEALEAGRGVAFGDLDQDGDVDLVLANSNGPLRLLLNQAPPGRSLSVELLRNKVNLPVEGSRVSVYLKDGRKLQRRSTRSGSYLSSNDPALHFGLGAESRAEKIVVDWPNGQRQEIEATSASRLKIFEKASAPNPKP
jgi:enediyne biosynthesis protein E4